ncbi:MAG: hypothetical protein AB7I27_11615 [Bacteriovoracaceae bacterium]
MAQDQTKKEALFNEVKGSLFEYLVCKELAFKNQSELEFHQSLDKNYLHVLTQQDRMVRQFYPEMISFLNSVAKKTVQDLVLYLGELPKRPKLLGKLSNSTEEFKEADLLLETEKKSIPLSLKLNKKNAFVNTKSGGIKSFFLQYFSFLPASYQTSFNQSVDLEFERMAIELHQFHGLDYPGNFSLWIKNGLSELPGELGHEERNILKSYYARLAKEVHRILSAAKDLDPKAFSMALAPLMGFSDPEILQLICFHDFKTGNEVKIEIHSFEQIATSLIDNKILPFHSISSVEIDTGQCSLQIRIKPMNKFTTTAIKMNCSTRFMRS